jgi:hypothetical protein
MSCPTFHFYFHGLMSEQCDVPRVYAKDAEGLGKPIPLRSPRYVLPDIFGFNFL